MKGIKVMLSESEIELLMYVTEGYSARAKLEAASGERDKDKAKKLTDELCAVNAKLYNILRKYHEKH